MYSIHIRPLERMTFLQYTFMKCGPYAWNVYPSEIQTSRIFRPPHRPGISIFIRYIQYSKIGIVSTMTVLSNADRELFITVYEIISWLFHVDILLFSVRSSYMPASKYPFSRPILRSIPIMSPNFIQRSAPLN